MMIYRMKPPRKPVRNLVFNNINVTINPLTVVFKDFRAIKCSLTYSSRTHTFEIYLNISAKIIIKTDTINDDTGILPMQLLMYTL
jgi:hypothetical protein